MIKEVKKLTVVALRSLSAVARHVAESPAGVASLATTGSAAAVSTTETTAIATTLLISTCTALTAVAGNVADFAALVAFLSTTHATSRTAGASIGRGSLLAVAGQVTNLTAAEAWLLLGRCGALAAQMALTTAVVACWVALGGALAGEMGGVTACVCDKSVSSFEDSMETFCLCAGGDELRSLQYVRLRTDCKYGGRGSSFFCVETSPTADYLRVKVLRNGSSRRLV